MRRITWLLLCLTCSARAMSQQADWSIYTGTDTLARGSFPARSAARIQGNMLGDSAWFQLTVKESRIAWRTRLVLTDSTERRLWSDDRDGSGRWLLPAEQIAGWLDSSKLVRLYLEFHPADPAISLRSQRSLLAFFTLNRDP